MGYLSSQDWFPWLIVSEESNDCEISCIFFWCVLGGWGLGSYYFVYYIQFQLFWLLMMELKFFKKFLIL